MSIPSRILKRSHNRNRVKRCIREFFRNHQKKLHDDVIIRLVEVPKDFDYATLTRPLEKFIESVKPEKKAGP